MKKQLNPVFQKDTIRKTIVAVSICLINTISFCQNPGSIRRVTSPEYSSGYVGWLSEIGVDHYDVNILQKAADETISTIGTISTTQQYVRIDPSIFTIGTTGYEIKGLDARGAVIFETGEVWPNVEDPLGVEEIASKVCVGKTYAWKLTCYAQITSQIPNTQGGFDNVLGHHYLKFNDAWQFYDNNTGTGTPYWQAVSDNEWATMVANQHPYIRQYWPEQAIEGSFEYGVYEKDNFNTNTPGGPFYNAEGFPVSSGRLVQKKLDEFIGFDGETTSPNASFTTPSFNTQGWIDFFNAHNDVDKTPWPGSLTWFNNGDVPEEISCNSSTHPSGGGGVLTGGPSDWYKDLYEHVELASIAIQGNGGINSWNDFVSLHNGLTQVGGGTEPTVESISIKSLTVSGVEVAMECTDDNFRLIKSEGRLVPGLYQLTIFTSDGNAVLAHYAIEFDLPEADQAEFVTLKANPNPITNHTLNLSFEFAKELSGQLIVHDIMGNYLHNEALSAGKGDFEKSILIETEMIQLFVSLILPDGSLKQIQVLNL